MRDLVGSSFAALLLLGSSALAFGQEVEPNGSCPKAQELRLETGSELEIDGSLDAKDADPTSDVDYFRVTATPGARIGVMYKAKFSLATGVFDERCEQFISGLGTKGSGQFAASESGVFFVAIGDSTDRGLLGTGQANLGAYEVRISELQGVFAIYGSVVDARTGEAIAGARVQLEDCFILCSFTLATATTSEDGFFFIDRDAEGKAIPGGRYRVVVDAPGHEQERSVLFNADEDALVDLREVFVEPAVCSAAPGEPPLGSLSRTLVR